MSQPSVRCPAGAACPDPDEPLTDLGRYLDHRFEYHRIDAGQAADEWEAAENAASAAAAAVRAAPRKPEPQPLPEPVQPPAPAPATEMTMARPCGYCQTTDHPGGRAKCPKRKADEKTGPRPGRPGPPPMAPKAAVTGGPRLSDVRVRLVERIAEKRGAVEAAKADLEADERALQVLDDLGKHTGHE